MASFAAAEARDNWHFRQRPLVAPRVTPPPTGYSAAAAQTPTLPAHGRVVLVIILLRRFDFAFFIAPFNCNFVDTSRASSGDNVPAATGDDAVSDARRRCRRRRPLSDRSVCAACSFFSSSTRSRGPCFVPNAVVPLPPRVRNGRRWWKPNAANFVHRPASSRWRPRRFRCYRCRRRRRPGGRPGSGNAGARRSPTTAAAANDSADYSNMDGESTIKREKIRFSRGAPLPLKHHTDLIFHIPINRGWCARPR